MHYNSKVYVFFSFDSFEVFVDGKHIPVFHPEHLSSTLIPANALSMCCPHPAS